MSEAAITALETEIAETEQTQEPTRAQIAELQAQLAAGDETIARNRAAISLLRGETAIPHTRTNPRSTTTRPRHVAVNGSPDAVSSDRIVDYLGANGTAKAIDIGNALGTSGPPLTKALKALVEAGEVVKAGEKRGTTYTLKGR